MMVKNDNGAHLSTVGGGGSLTYPIVGKMVQTGRERTTKLTKIKKKKRKNWHSFATKKEKTFSRRTGAAKKN